MSCCTTKTNNTSKKNTEEVILNSNRLHDIWVVKELFREKLQNISDETPKQITLEIFTNDMKILGNDGCNNFFGKIIKVDASKISFTSIGSTKKMCPDMETSNNFYKAMNDITSYRLEKTYLYLLDANNNELLKLLKVD